MLSQPLLTGEKGKLYHGCSTRSNVGDDRYDSGLRFSKITSKSRRYNKKNLEIPRNFVKVSGNQSDVGNVKRNGFNYTKKVAPSNYFGSASGHDGKSHSACCNNCFGPKPVNKKFKKSPHQNSPHVLKNLEILKKDMVGILDKIDRFDHNELEQYNKNKKIKQKLVPNANLAQLLCSINKYRHYRRNFGKSDHSSIYKDLDEVIFSQASQDISNIKKWDDGENKMFRRLVNGMEEISVANSRKLLGVKQDICTDNATVKSSFCGLLFGSILRFIFKKIMDPIYKWISLLYMHFRRHVFGTFPSPPSKDPFLKSSYLGGSRSSSDRARL